MLESTATFKSREEPLARGFFLWSRVGRFEFSSYPQRFFGTGREAVWSPSSMTNPPETLLGQP